MLKTGVKDHPEGGGGVEEGKEGINGDGRRDLTWGGEQSTIYR